MKTALFGLLDRFTCVRDDNLQMASLRISGADEAI
jgi:hypothetical protein